MSDVSVPEDRNLAAVAMQAWTQGQQDQAIATLRPQADGGYAWANALLAWFLHQRGEPGWREAIPYATRAVEMGRPWAANYVIGNMMNDASLRAQGAELMKRAAVFGLPADPIGWAQQALLQGDAATGTALLDAQWPGPLSDPQGWQELVDAALQARRALQTLEKDARADKSRLDGQVAQAIEEISSHRTTIETQTSQLTTLLEQVTNAEAKSFFEEEAKANERESRVLWRWGVGVVAGAALLAITPLVLHYVGKGPDLTSTTLLTAHFAPTAALAGVSGVLLSRARGRDRTRQRARDLSVALGTMFVYAHQIADEGERQRFLHDMGRAVIESFLKQEGHERDDTGGMLSLLAGKTR